MGSVKAMLKLVNIHEKRSDNHLCLYLFGMTRFLKLVVDTHPRNSASIITP